MICTNHPHRGGLLLWAVPTRRRLSRHLFLRHDSILVSKVRNLRHFQGDSNLHPVSGLKTPVLVSLSCHLTCHLYRETAYTCAVAVRHPSLREEMTRVPSIYLMDATRSPDIATSCGPQVPQSCSPPIGISKCPFWPPMSR